MEELIKNKIKELEEEDLEIDENWDTEDVRIAKFEQRAILDFCYELLEDYK